MPAGTAPQSDAIARTPLDSPNGYIPVTSVAWIKKNKIDVSSAVASTRNLSSSSTSVALPKPIALLKPARQDGYLTATQEKQTRLSDSEGSYTKGGTSSRSDEKIFQSKPAEESAVAASIVVLESDITGITGEETGEKLRDDLDPKTIKLVQAPSSNLKKASCTFACLWLWSQGPNIL